VKDVSDDYITKETAEERKPVELYRIWLGDDTSNAWYYTSADYVIAYNGNNYIPAPISRGAIEWDVELQIPKLTITVWGLQEAVTQFIASNPIELVWVEVLRAFRDQSPVECAVIFIGQIRNVTFQGPEAQCECVGMEYFLEKPIPTIRYQANCNWRVFDERCGLVSGEYLQTVTVTNITSGESYTLTTDMDTKEDDYYAYGWMEWGIVKRMIASSSGQEITLNYPITTLGTGEAINIYPGCDGAIETCRDKYDNVLNFGGHPYIPEDNPSAWSDY